MCISVLPVANPEPTGIDRNEEICIRTGVLERRHLYRDSLITVNVIVIHAERVSWVHE
ncbi:uncharacterized protein BT62DRAFT_930853 [Guyanagaster necrorhizus]|uniref:Uncharacterized protein n=1 Tax=Guyanagaster necrorhizus TaxID=856835 RepID=A0A9P7VX49_9AGAR|nr:uncharacterized protein BT62DRAFT_930853 [Guyanagaster necrorhizus MCA 3950]KAG7447809.1 hypothetical protein BT62DRAFT_930853 [Guyanagaster necrorhizus MCA 3950]